MVAAGVAIDARRAAELAADDDEGAIAESAAVGQIAEERERWPPSSAGSSSRRSVAKLLSCVSQFE